MSVLLHHIQCPSEHTSGVAQHEDQDEDLSEFKAAKRIESADLLAKLKV